MLISFFNVRDAIAKLFGIILLNFTNCGIPQG
jgi:hypothetical protein